MELTDTVALITGGTRMGLAVASALSSRGTDVALAYANSHAAAHAAAEAVRGVGRRAETFQTNLADAPSCAALVDRVVETFGRLDILINMASVYQYRSFGALTVADWDAVLSVDLRAAFLCAHAAVPHLRVRGGRIINFGDWTASSGRPRYHGFLPYYVAKAGIEALTEGLAFELAADHILVNAIAPGPILPRPGSGDAARRVVEQATPLGRWGGAEEIAKAVLSLLHNDFITGETLRVDGGRHLS